MRIDYQDYQDHISRYLSKPEPSKRAYQCDECDSINMHDEWMEATLQEVCRRSGLETSVHQLTQLHRSDFEGESWFVCPSCRETIADFEDRIIEVDPPIHNNSMAAFLLLDNNY